MNTKLTLNINKSIIEKAKVYALENEISLSKLIESYLTSIVSNTKNKTTISSLVESLTGIIPNETEKTARDDYFAYLSKKHA